MALCQLSFAGIGPWKLSCLAIWTLGYPDALPKSDAVLRGALAAAGRKEPGRAQRRWAPRHSYATVRLRVEAADFQAGGLARIASAEPRERTGHDDLLVRLHDNAENRVVCARIEIVQGLRRGVGWEDERRYDKRCRTRRSNPGTGPHFAAAVLTQGPDHLQSFESRGRWRFVCVGADFSRATSPSMTGGARPNVLAHEPAPQTTSQIRSPDSTAVPRAAGPRRHALSVPIEPGGRLAPPCAGTMLAYVRHPPVPGSRLAPLSAFGTAR